MNEQLSLFPTVEDGKRQALQRFLDTGQLEPTVSISTYSPNGRKTEYYRLVYRSEKKVKAIHIKGGNTKARLANYRVNKLQTMIDRGAELSEILAAVSDFNR